MARKNKKGQAEQVRIELATARLDQLAAAKNVKALKGVVQDLIEIAGETDDGRSVPVSRVWDGIGSAMGFEQLSAEGLGDED